MRFRSAPLNHQQITAACLSARFAPPLSQIAQ